MSLSSQTLLVSGGWDGGGVCDDFWIVDLSTRRWKKVGTEIYVVHVHVLYIPFTTGMTRAAFYGCNHCEPSPLDLCV